MGYSGEYDSIVQTEEFRSAMLPHERFGGISDNTDPGWRTTVNRSWIRYFFEDQIHEDLLTYMPVMSRAPRLTREDPPWVAADHFAWTHGVIDLPNRDEHRFRFYEDNRYQILDPYTTLPNDPWYARIRFNVNPMPAEWTRMLVCAVPALHGRHLGSWNLSGRSGD